MAQLKSLLVTGAARFINIIHGDISGNAATATKLETSRTIQTNLASTSTASFDGSGNVSPGVTGTLPLGNGGTGKTNANDAANNLISGLPAWTAAPTDDTYLVRQDTGGTSTFGRVKFSTVWTYISGKISSVLGLTASTYGGNAATATKATQDESGNNIKATYAASASISGNTVTLKNKNGGTLSTVTIPTELPAVTSSDNGKVLRVVSGAWSAVNLPSASGVSF